MMLDSAAYRSREWLTIVTDNGVMRVRCECWDCHSASQRDLALTSQIDEIPNNFSDLLKRVVEYEDRPYASYTTSGILFLFRDRCVCPFEGCTPGYRRLNDIYSSKAIAAEKHAGNEYNWIEAGGTFADSKTSESADVAWWEADQPGSAKDEGAKAGVAKAEVVSRDGTQSNVVSPTAGTSVVPTSNPSWMKSGLMYGNGVVISICAVVATVAIVRLVSWRMRVK